MGRRICGGGRRTSGRSLCVRESSSRSAAREEKKNKKSAPTAPDKVLEKERGMKVLE